MASKSAATNTMLPPAKPITPFWRTELDQLDDVRTTPDLPPQSDIVIIGAGYSGVTLAYYLLKQLADQGDKTTTVTLLEARQICSGATGRNGGHLRPDIYGHIPTYITRYGLDAGVEIADFEYAHIQALKDLLREENIDCDLNITRNMNAYLDDVSAENARKAYEMLLARGVELAKDLHYTSQRDAEGVSGIKGAKACISYTSGTLWPYKFILGLLNKIIHSTQLNVQTHTPVTSITTEGETHTIHTPRGSLRAGKIAYATNAYTAGLLPEYSDNIVPCRGICCHITVPEGKTAPFLPYSYAIGYGSEVVNGGSYLITRPDGSIIVGGAQYTFKRDLAQWYGVVDDTTLIESAKNYYDGYMQRTFRGWEDSGAYVKEIWTGVMGYSYDSHPHIGQVPNKPGQYICAGFNGHGMPVILLSAKELAGMIQTGKSFEETRMPRMFKTSEERIEKARTGPKGGDILA
ncbi:FAD dependent oxidoreductase superfamily [Aspergillus sclerotioniger CBS 115572]|uniref:FAD dependent oxidoreductase superfamily n=1 Tax=Aspergillus sclerotioniger CBS 115572 TaxID=1450535 RepID=A0A317WH30_9EURO|nr:FAD dependent oxidoreductase superfamily [Aspergillus sclerotioniger CBS 115572]PWY85786.1 FAD dependent oxidoreductase superfamily [Aspergillus sclerotioniger CBS 115572]